MDLKSHGAYLFSGTFLPIGETHLGMARTHLWGMCGISNKRGGLVESPQHKLQIRVWDGATLLTRGCCKTNFHLEKPLVHFHACWKEGTSPHVVWRQADHA